MNVLERHTKSKQNELTHVAEKNTKIMHMLFIIGRYTTKEPVERSCPAAFLESRPPIFLPQSSLR